MGMLLLLSMLANVTLHLPLLNHPSPPPVEMVLLPLPKYRVPFPYLLPLTLPTPLLTSTTNMYIFNPLTTASSLTLSPLPPSLKT